MAEEKKTAAAKKPVEKKKEAVKKAVKKKLDNIIFEIDGVQFNLKDIEKKAASLGGTVYVVVSEKKIYDVDGNSVDL